MFILNIYFQIADKVFNLSFLNLSTLSGHTKPPTFLWLCYVGTQCNLSRLVEDRGLGSLVRKSNTDLKRETGRVYSAVFPMNIAVTILTKLISAFLGFTVLRKIKSPFFMRCSVPQISTDRLVKIIVALVKTDLQVC